MTLKREPTTLSESSVLAAANFPDTGEVIWKFWSEVWWKYSAGLIQRICSATDNTLLGQRLHWGLPRHQGHAPCPEIKRESNCEGQAGIEFSAWSKGRRGGRVSHNPLICQTDKSVRIKYGGGKRGAKAAVEGRWTTSVWGEGSCSCLDDRQGARSRSFTGCLTLQLKILEWGICFCEIDFRLGETSLMTGWATCYLRGSTVLGKCRAMARDL